jgi:hypothetical protein
MKVRRAGRDERRALLTEDGSAVAPNAGSPRGSDALSQSRKGVRPWAGGIVRGNIKAQDFRSMALNSAAD